MSYYKKATHSIRVIVMQRFAPQSLGNEGFTLLELLVICAILGILATLAIPTYNIIKDKARNARAELEIQGLEKSIVSWSIDKAGANPDRLDQLGLQANDLIDPWGQLYVYNNNDTNPDAQRKDTSTSIINKDFDLYSTGSNRVTDPQVGDTDNSKDDIMRAGDGQFVGTAQKYLNPLDF